MTIERLNAEALREAVKVARDVVDNGIDAADSELLAMAVLSLDADRTALAKLASDTPQFDNPLRVWEAQILRDEILGSSPGGET